MRYYLPALLLMLIACATQAQKNLTAFANKRTGAFTENLGQVIDQYGQPVPGVLAKGSLPGLDIYLTQTGLTYVLLQYEEDAAAEQHPVFITNNTRYKVHCSRVDVELPGAALSKAQLEFSKSETYKAGYYYGNVQLAEVAQYRKLTVKNVYPGIDWVWQINNSGKAEYDFVVHPGADAAAIKMIYHYADVTAGNKELTIATRLAALREGRLKATAGGKQIEADYVYSEKEKTVSFKLGAYDTTKDLVIDPPLTLQWSAQYGGNFADGLRGVATDTSNDAYLTGYTTSTNFPVFAADSAVYRDSTFNGNTDVILLKVAPDQTLLWATYLGGPGNDFANSIAVNKYGSVFITGSAESGYPTRSVAYGYNDSLAAGNDIFVTAFNTDLTMAWSTFLGGTGHDEALKIYDIQDYGLYLTGYTSSGSTFPLRYGGSLGYAATSPKNGYNNPFVTHFNYSGGLDFNSGIPDTANAYGTSLGSVSRGLILTGFSASPKLNFYPANNGLQINNGGIDGFILSFGGGWGRFIGGAGNDYITDITTTDSCFAVTGRTNSLNFPVRPGPGLPYMQPQCAGGYDAFIAKFYTDSVIRWSTYYGGSNDDAATGITNGAHNSFQLCGFSFSTDFPVIAPANGGYFQSNNKGQADGFITSFTEYGMRTYSTYKGDSCYEYPLDMAVCRNGDFYVCGEGLFACGQSLPGSIPLPDTASADGSTSGFCWGFGGDEIAGCLDVDINVIQQPCPGMANGIAAVTYGGGTPPYHVTWSNGSQADTIFDLSSARAVVVVTDSTGCATDRAIAGKPLTVSNTGRNVDCYHLTNNVSIYSIYGNPPYTYLWSTGDTARVLTLGVGNYTATVTDKAGCSAVANATVQWHDLIDTVIILAQRPRCGFENGILAAKTTYHSISTVVEWYDSNNHLLAINDTLYNVAPGTYYINAYSCINGRLIQDSITVTDPGIIDTFTVEIDTIYRGCDYGYTWLEYVVTGGSNTNLSFEWGDDRVSVLNNGSFYFSETGNYTVTVTNGNGCTANATAIVVQDSIHLEYLNINYPLCVNSLPGSMSSIGAYIVVSDHTIGLNNWETQEMIFVYTGQKGFVDTTTYVWNYDLIPDIYNVQVIDLISGCSLNLNLNITALPANVQVNALPVGCGANTGSIEVTGAEQNLFWSNSNGDNFGPSASLYNLPPDTYYTSVNNQSLCVIIGQEPDSMAVRLDSVRVSCTQNAYLQANVSGGTGPYGYVWSSQFAHPGWPTAAMSYYNNNNNNNVTVTDMLGCSVSAVSNYVFRPGLQLSSSYFPRCNSDSTDLRLYLAGGFPPYTINTGATTFNTSSSIVVHAFNGGTSPTITVSDSVGCYITRHFAFSHHNYLKSAYTYTAPTCNAAGSITITATGGTPPYTGLGTFPLFADNMFVVMDNAGCRDTIRLNFKLNLTASIGPLACGSTLSAVTIHPHGGTPPYSGDTGTYTRPAGIYTFIVNDAGGCTDTLQVTVPAQAALHAAYTATPIACYGDTTTVNITATGGWLPYNNTVGNYRLPAGSYTYVVIDSAGCTDTLTLNLSQPASAMQVAYQVQNPACYGNTGTVTLSVTGGVPPYSGNTGTFTRPAGNYTFIVTDSAGCNANVPVTVSQPTAVQATYTAAPIPCYGDTTTVSISATGGMPPYSGTTGTYRLPAGSYTYVVIDSAGCADTLAFNLSQPSGALELAYNSQNPACYGTAGTVTLSATGGTQPYSGDTGTYVTPAGDYTFTVTDSAGCAANVHVSIIQPAVLQANYTIAPIACYDNTATVTITATGGWPPYNQVVGTHLLPWGNYTYIITDSLGCADTLAFNLSQLDGAMQVAYQVQNPVCFGNTGTVAISVTGGVPPYSGDTGTYTRPGGNYTFIVADSAGCIDTVQINVIEPAVLQAAYTAAPIACYADTTTVNITATGGWLPYNSTVGNYRLPAGSYTYVVIDSAGCTDTLTFNLGQPASAMQVAYQVQNPACFGNTGTVSLSVTGGVPPYSGNTGTFTRPAGNYTFIVTDSAGCNANVPVTVSQPTAVQASYTAAPIPCYGSTTTIAVSATGGTPGYTGDLGTHILPAGNYVYTVYDTAGCMDSIHITVTEPAALAFTAHINDTVPCNAAAVPVTISATGGTPPYSNSGVFTIVTDSIYSWQVTDGNGCTTTDTVAVNLPGGSVEITGAEDSVCKNGHVQLSASGNYNFTWNGHVQGSTFTINGIQTSTMVTLAAYDALYNCHLTDTAFITVVQCLGIEDMGANNLLSIYPNPASSLLYLKANYAVEENVLVKMFAADGKLVAAQQMNKGEYQTDINCEKLASGTYMLLCTYGQNTSRYKVVVNH